MTARRKAVVERLRLEGRAAFEGGRNIETCPYQFTDAYQWKQGYRSAEEERPEGDIYGDC